MELVIVASLPRPKPLRERALETLAALDALDEDDEITKEYQVFRV